MIKLTDIKSVFLVGVGGIGMSALARYFKLNGKSVGGYDRVQTVLTNELMAEGIDIHFTDSVDDIADEYKEKASTLVIYTPAIPGNNEALQFFTNNGFEVKKRAEVLGLLSNDMEAVCVAGTHGKTTTSTLAAHLYKQSSVGCNAFLGGISRNYGTNFLHHPTSNYVVLEADEFDRSFLHLSPFIAVLTSMDADHLDIYGTRDKVVDAFNDFIKQITPGGALVVKEGLPIDEVDEDVELFTYSLEPTSDFHPVNIRLEKELYCFDLKSPLGDIKKLKLGIPGLLNVENAVGAIALAMLGGVQGDEIRKSLASFQGIRRRFDYRINTDKVVFIDDYAHHPEEIKAALKSVRDIYPHRKVTVVFQPHLFSRTNDFASEFAEALDMADRVLMLDIYPARELPMEGVTSSIIVDRMHLAEVSLVANNKITEELIKQPLDVILTLGAGDIDKLVPVLESDIAAIIK